MSIEKKIVKVVKWQKFQIDKSGRSDKRDKITKVTISKISKCQIQGFKCIFSQEDHPIEYYITWIKIIVH